MRIALIRRTSITHLDGVNRFIAWLAEGLHKLGHEPIIMNHCYGEEVPRDELGRWFKEMHGLDVELPIETLRDKPCREDSLVKTLFEWYINGSKLLKKLNINAAIVNGIVPLRFKPKIAVAHGPIHQKSGLERILAKILYQTYDTVVCVSKKSEGEYNGITECNAIISLPMKLNLYMPKDVREDIIVHIGIRKNPHISIKAVELMVNKGLRAELYIIGSKNPQVERLIEGKPYIHALFNASEREKIDILCRAKALILPSPGEVFSYSTLEAMACGTPPVVSSAVPEEVIIDNVNGLRITSLNPSEYAKALERLFRDDELWSRLSRKGLDFVKQFDYVEIARKYVNLINYHGSD